MQSRVESYGSSKTAPFYRKEKPTLRKVGTVSGTELVRDRLMLLAPPSGVAGAATGMQGGAPTQLPQGTGWGPFNSG